VLVDEYQDINRGQERMIRLIAGPKANLWAVGDPDQAVYGFRGSDIRYILNFGRIYPQHTCVELDVNFRSTATIVEAANRFIANNRHRFGRVITSARASGTPLQFQGAEDPEAEANWVAGEIRKLIDAGTPAEEIAVLTRVAYHANWVEQALSARGVPFGLLGMSNFWGRPEVKQALGAISVLTRTSLVDGEPRLSRRLREAIGSVDPDDLVATAKVVCKTVARRPPKTISGQRREAWTSAMGLLSQEIERHKDPEALARKIRARSAIGEQSGKGVSVGTIHAAKGLEWAAVFLVACERDVLPHAKNPDLEEERRLAFVALTRARDQFVCSWSLTRSRKESAPSPFVAELKRAAQVSGA
jgi:DNA helicase-2/ATP-dependent DNA helicase PcrA